MWSMNERALGPKRTLNAVMPEHDEILSLSITIANCRAAVRIVQFTDPQGAISLKGKRSQKASDIARTRAASVGLGKGLPLRRGSRAGSEPLASPPDRCSGRSPRATAKRAAHRSQRRQDREGSRCPQPSFCGELGMRRVHWLIATARASAHGAAYSG
jgi:hypothetical protein